MTDHGAEPTGLGLQFDRAVKTDASPGEAVQGAVTCAGCHQSIETEYFDINGRNVCATCRQSVEAAAESPRGVGVLLRAALFGTGAAIVGALIYYAVLAIAHLEIGLIAILSGYMVGMAIRKATNGRGGLRFQILALLLTYLSVAMAYTPVVIQSVREHRAQARAQSTATAKGDGDAAASDAPTNPAPQPKAVGFVTGILILAGFVAALPVLVVFGGLPTSLISGLIIGFGMRQAWRMTGTPTLTIFGPYRVGAAPAATP